MRSGHSTPRATPPAAAPEHLPRGQPAGTFAVPLTLSALAEALRENTPRRRNKLEQLVRAYPDHALSWLALAEVYREDCDERARPGAAGRALAAMERAIALDPRLADYASIPLLRTWEAASPDSPANTDPVLRQLREARETKSRRQILASLRRILARNPDNELVLYHFAVASAQAGKRDHAAYACARLLESKSEQCFLRFLLAEACKGHWPSSRQNHAVHGEVEATRQLATAANSSRSQSVAERPVSVALTPGLAELGAALEARAAARMVSPALAAARDRVAAPNPAASPVAANALDIAEDIVEIDRALEPIPNQAMARAIAPLASPALVASPSTAQSTARITTAAPIADIDSALAFGRASRAGVALAIVIGAGLTAAMLAVLLAILLVMAR